MHQRTLKQGEAENGFDFQRELSSPKFLSASEQGGNIVLPHPRDNVVGVFREGRFSFISAWLVVRSGLEIVPIAAWCVKPPQTFFNEK